MHSYIVVLKSSELSARGQRVADAAASMLPRAGALLHAYEHALTGFAAKMSEAHAKALLADPRVAYVERNGVIEAYAVQPGAA